MSDHHADLLATYRGEMFTAGFSITAVAGNCSYVGIVNAAANNKLVILKDMVLGGPSPLIGFFTARYPEANFHGTVLTQGNNHVLGGALSTAVLRFSNSVAALPATGKVDTQFYGGMDAQIVEPDLENKPLIIPPGQSFYVVTPVVNAPLKGYFTWWEKASDA